MNQQDQHRPSSQGSVNITASESTVEFIDALPFDAPVRETKVSSFRLTTSHCLLFGLGLLTILFIVFITVARSVEVVTYTSELENPKEKIRQAAKLKFDTFLKLPIGNRILLLPGKHVVRATADGFEEGEFELELTSERSQRFEFVLMRLPGKLNIKLSPSLETLDQVVVTNDLGNEAKVLKQDEPILLEAGRRTIVVDAPLYRPTTRSVLIQGKNEAQEIEVTLDPAWATLTLNSTPTGAEVLIDDVSVGVTPVSLKVEEGLHNLKVQAAKFKPFTHDFRLVAQQDISVPDIHLIPADGVLTINTSPVQAAVILNGEYQGVSPVTVKVPPSKPQQLQVYSPGFHLSDDEVVLAPAQKASKTVELRADSVAVRFSITPDDAELLIDGVSHGRGPNTLNLSTLPHKIVARKAGYVSYQNTVIPTKSGQQVVSIKLLTKAQHFWATVPNRYTTQEGQTMLMFKSPGVVKLGSSRRESGRRSNETMYTARLTKHFYVSQHEITNKQFRRFKPAHSSGNYKRRSLDSNKHPVVNVTWQDVAKYCNWLSKKEGFEPFYTTKAGFVAGHIPDADGYRLLTEHEWAWLARNKNGETLRYSWGQSAVPDQIVDNYADKNAADFLTFTIADYDDGYKASSPIGRYQANHNDLYDMGGNVAEWVNDWYSPNSDLTGSSSLVDWLGPAEGEFHVIRGGSWARGHLPQLRLAYRDFGAKGVHDVGFRIARYVKAPK